MGAECSKGTERAREIEKARMDAVAGEGSGTNERRGQREEWDHMNAVPGGDGEGEPLCIRSGIGKWREVGPSTHTQTTTRTRFYPLPPPPARAQLTLAVQRRRHVPPLLQRHFRHWLAVPSVRCRGTGWNGSANRRTLPQSLARGCPPTRAFARPGQTEVGHTPGLFLTPPAPPPPRTPRTPPARIPGAPGVPYAEDCGASTTACR